MKNKKILFDVILITALLAASLAALLLVRLGAQTGEMVRVSVNGQTVCEYSLDTDGRYALNGGTNILVIEDGAAYMAEADCPDGVCINTGRISRTGERIVCLPNKLLVEVVGNGDGMLGG